MAGQIIAIGDELASVGAVIADDEAELHAMACRMFALTPDDWWRRGGHREDGGMTPVDGG